MQITYTAIAESPRAQRRVRAMALLAASALVLQACTTPNAYLNPQPPRIKPSTEVAGGAATYYTTMETAGSAEQYVAYGYADAYRACTTYFDNLIQIQNQTGFTSDVVAATGSTAAAVVALRQKATVAAHDLARISAGASFLATVFSAYEKRLLMTPYPSETKGLVLAAIAKYEADAPPSAVTSYGEADRWVQGYAEVCTYSGITRFSKQALANARPSNDSASNTSAIPESEQIFAAAVATAFGIGERLGDRQLAVLHYYINVNPKAFSDANAQAVLKELPPSVGAQLGLGSTALDPTTVPQAMAAKYYLGKLADTNLNFQAVVAQVVTDLTPPVAGAPAPVPAVAAPGAAPPAPRALSRPPPMIRF